MGLGRELLTAAAAPSQPLPRFVPRLAAVTTPSDWSALMVAAQAGNGGVYHRLLVEVGAWLRRYYWKRLPPAMVEDAVQDTLMAIHEKRHTYDPARPIEPWLAAIALQMDR